MSFTKEKRRNIKLYILEKIDAGRKDLASSAAESFGISLNTAYRYIHEMEQENIIAKSGGRYVPVRKRRTIELPGSRQKPDSEDRIYLRYFDPEIKELPENVRGIWQYAFCEMMNNVIDHAQAEHVTLEISKDYLNTALVIADDGAGIFRKLKEYFGFAAQEEAIRELYKGKLTTDKERHSGEGIFFTSRAVDTFAAVSGGGIFSHNRFDEVVRDFSDSSLMADWEKKDGTIIYMKLSNFSSRQMKEVFDQYSSVEDGFYKTSIPVKNMFDMLPVARSQARRLCQNFEKFREIELDFEGVGEIGQGFAHELFVVYARQHPDIRLVPVHTGEDVEKMIRHVTASALSAD